LIRRLKVGAIAIGGAAVLQRTQCGPKASRAQTGIAREVGLVENFKNFWVKHQDFARESQ
jgi:hypothetical protein